MKMSGLWRARAFLGEVRMYSTQRWRSLPKASQMARTLFSMTISISCLPSSRFLSSCHPMKPYPTGSCLSGPKCGKLFRMSVKSCFTDAGVL